MSNKELEYVKGLTTYVYIFLNHIYMPVLIIGKVFANWCGYCQQLKPEWNKLKKMSKAQIVEFEANQTQEKSDFENMHGIQLEVAGYPTIFKITPDKKVHYYGGPRRAIDIHKWSSSSPSPKTRRRKIEKSKQTRNRRRRYPRS